MATRPGPFLYEGWICMPYDGHDLSRVELAVGATDPQPAYLDWVNGQRVAKLRPSHLGYPTGTVNVSLRVDGITTDTGRVTL